MSVRNGQEARPFLSRALQKNTILIPAALVSGHGRDGSGVDTDELRRKKEKVSLCQTVRCAFVVSRCAYFLGENVKGE